MRADLDALETFAASLSDAEIRTVVGIGRIRTVVGIVGADRARGAADVGGSAHRGRRGGGGEARAAARDAAAAGTSGAPRNGRSTGDGGRGWSSAEDAGGGGARVRSAGGEETISHTRENERVFGACSASKFWFRFALRASSVIGAIVSSILGSAARVPANDNWIRPGGEGHTHIFKFSPDRRRRARGRTLPHAREARGRRACLRGLARRPITEDGVAAGGTTVRLVPAFASFGEGNSSHLGCAHRVSER